MLTARQSTAVLLLALLHQSHEFATVAVRSRALRRQHRCSVAASSSDDSNVDAASAFLSSPRPATGKEAFDGSTWSVLLRLAEQRPADGSAPVDLDTRVHLLDQVRTQAHTQY